MKYAQMIPLAALMCAFAAPAHARTNITQREIDDALFEAVEYRYKPAKVEELLQQGADPDAEAVRNVNSIETGETLWLYALERSPSEIISLLKHYRKPGKPMSPGLQARAFSTAMNTTQVGNPGYTMERVQLLIDNGLDVNDINLEDLTNKARRGGDGESPLMIAAGKDKEEFVKFLLVHGADARLKTRTGENALFFARSAAITQDLLEAGADASAVGQYERTALQEAIMNGRAEVVATLLDKGGSLASQKADEALLLACRVMRQTSNKEAAEHVADIIKMLLDHKVDPNLTIQKEGWEDSPLFEAVRANNTAGIKLLLDAGADPTKVHNGKGSLLELAVQQDDPEITRLLWTHYAPLSDADKDSLLRVAVQYGKPKVLALLAEYGVKVTEAKNQPGGVDPAVEGLIHAINEEKADMVEALLVQGVDINASGYNQTPLTAAAQYNHAKMVELLVEKGADVNRADKTGMTPLAVAISNGSLEIYRFLKSKQANPLSSDTSHPYLHLAVSGMAYPRLAHEQDGSVDILRDLIDAGNPADQLDAEGTTPLWRIATMPGNDGSTIPKLVESVKLLLLHGAKADWVPAQCAHISPAKNPGTPPVPQQNMVQVAERMQIDPEAQLAYQCRTPLSNAAATGNKAIMTVLIDSGAQVNWPSPVNGETPLMLAANYGDPQIVSLLVDKGADTSLRNARGQTAADIARERQNTKALAILEAHENH